MTPFSGGGALLLTLLALLALLACAACAAFPFIVGAALADARSVQLTPGVDLLAQLSDYLGLLRRQVGLLADILPQIEQLDLAGIVHQFPVAGANRGLLFRAVPEERFVQ